MGREALKAIWPIVLEREAPWPDYALLDFGRGEKLERYGDYTLRRPEPQAFAEVIDESLWKEADAVFVPLRQKEGFSFREQGEEENRGSWQLHRSLPDRWEMGFKSLRFFSRLMAFRHTGVFPEQAVHWNWIESMCRMVSMIPQRPRVLNLFGYTGIASLIASAEEAEVVHVDASKKALLWARENQACSLLSHAPIRWICEDVPKFVAREIRRGRRYEGIILDPPKFGRGPEGEIWDLFRDLPTLLLQLRQLLAEKEGFVLLSTYALRASSCAFHELMRTVFEDEGGILESGEVVLRCQIGERLLSTSHFSRWSRPC